MAGRTVKNSSGIHVFLVDDHPLIRQGLAGFINQETDMSVCGEAESVVEALDGIQKALPDLVVVDISLQNGNGLELIKELHGRYPQLPVLVLSMHAETSFAERALRAGARGYVVKHEASEKILTAIRQVYQGGVFLSDHLKDVLLRQLVCGAAINQTTGMDRLSDRELEVFHLLGEGFGTRQIAEKLGISVKTVETYRAHLKRKLKLPNGTELVRYAIQWSKSGEQSR
jgi:DNA-binding NarL/FixJ family response regulator